MCLLIGQLGLGGAEKQVTLLALGLQARGIRTSVLVLYDGGPHEATLREAGVSVIHLGGPRRFGRTRRPAIRGARSPRALLRWVAWFLAAALDYASRLVRLVRVLRRERPDLLHAFLFHSYVAGALAAKPAGVPLAVAGRRSLSDAGGLRGHPLALAVARGATRLTDLVIANARVVAEDARRVEGIPAAKIVTIYNGIGTAAFEPASPADLDADVPMVLCVANLTRYKGHYHLLRAASRLRERNIACALVLVGDGPERDGLQKAAADLGVDARFLGQRTDVPALLARADVVVLPSLSEGMSNAVMEAMAAGKPVVATDVGGNGELLRGRGVLVPPADPDALADGLAEVLSDPERARRTGAEARRWSLQNLHVDTMVDKHVDVYTRLWESRCAG